MGNCQKINIPPNEHFTSRSNVVANGALSTVETESTCQCSGEIFDSDRGKSLSLINASCSLKASSLGEHLNRHSAQRELRGIQYMCSSLEVAKAASKSSCLPILQFEISSPVDESELREVFSHPLVMEAAESLFVTLLQTESITPKNTSRLTAIRVLNENGEGVVHVSGGKDLNLASFVSMMCCGLKACGVNVPTYLALVEAEENARVKRLVGNTVQRIDQNAVYGMPDPLLAEIEFASKDGVLATRIGYFGREKVVDVTYNSTQISYGELTCFALHRQIADVIFWKSNEERISALIEVRKSSSTSVLASLDSGFSKADSKHALRQTFLRYVPLTHLQATKINRLIAMGVFNEATRLLSPRQGVIMMRAMRTMTQPKFFNAVDVPIELAWSRIPSEVDDRLEFAHF